jgi:hypothetical protein
VDLTHLTNNWKTTLTGIIPLAVYGLNYFGLWPSAIPLPPFDQVWPFVASVFGLGISAKDATTK